VVRDGEDVLRLAPGKLRSNAGVAQLVEHQLPKLRVVGSNPIARFMSRNPIVAVLVATATVAFPACAGAEPVAKPKIVTTVAVTEYEYGFKLSRQTVPAGRVTFVMRNSGAIVHNFDLIGVKSGAFLVSGQRATMTVTLKHGEYTYVCSVKYHAAQGMQGTLYVK
jgi:plastocyanin